jgi:predicted nucleic acid-binding protein
MKSSNLTMIGDVSYILSILICCRDMKSGTLVDAHLKNCNPFTEK